MADARDTLNKLCFACGLPGKDAATELTKYIQQLQAGVEAKKILDKNYLSKCEELHQQKQALEVACLQLVEVHRALKIAEKRSEQIAAAASTIASGLQAVWNAQALPLSLTDEETIEMLNETIAPVKSGVKISEEA